MKMIIKAGDLVKFKHHIFDEHRPIFLVTEAWQPFDEQPDASDRYSRCIRLLGEESTDHRAENFVVVSQGVE